MSTIYILWLRQIKRYWRTRTRIIGSLGQPVLFLISLGYGLGSVYQRGVGGNYIEFLAPGIIAMSILFTAVFSGMEIIWDKQFGFLKETLVAPVSRFSIMIGRTLGSATVAIFQGIIVFFLAMLFGFRPFSLAYLPIALVFMFLIGVLFTAIGTAIASKLDDMQGFQLVMNFLVMPVFFLSGAMFPLTGLPHALTVVTRINPLSYGIDAIRTSLINQGSFPLMFSFSLLLILVIITIGIGAYFFKRVEV